MFRLRQQFCSGLHFKEMIKYAFSFSILPQIMSAGKAPWVLWEKKKCCSVSWWMKGSRMLFYLDKNKILFASACSSYMLSSSLSSFLEHLKCPWTHRCPTHSHSVLAVLCCALCVEAGSSSDSSGHRPFLAASTSVVFLQLPWHCLRRVTLPQVLSISVLCNLGGHSMMDSRMLCVPPESACV